MTPNEGRYTVYVIALVAGGLTESRMEEMGALGISEILAKLVDYDTALSTIAIAKADAL